MYICIYIYYGVSLSLTCLPRPRGGVYLHTLTRAGGQPGTQAGREEHDV
jgi:hypothetical protein